MRTRIAILLANNDESVFSLQFPNDGEKVARHLADVRPQWVSQVWSVKDGEFPRCTDADAFVITGSPASVHDPLPWISRLVALVREIHREALPLIGLCFGHQVVAAALDGKVESNPSGWRFGAVETQFQGQHPWMRPEKNILRLFTSHSEQVTRLPAGAELLGSNSYCPNAAFAIGQHVLTTQYHPEFTADFMKALAREYEGEVPVAILQAGRPELDLPNDGRVFFQWMARFIESATMQGKSAA